MVPRGPDGPQRSPKLIRAYWSYCFPLNLKGLPFAIRSFLLNRMKDIIVIIRPFLLNLLYFNRFPLNIGINMELSVNRPPRSYRLTGRQEVIGFGGRPHEVIGFGDLWGPSGTPGDHLGTIWEVDSMKLSVRGAPCFMLKVVSGRCCGTTIIQIETQ